MKYNFKIQKGNLTFEVDGCDSFDEAVKKCEKGVYEYELAHGLIGTMQSTAFSPNIPTKPSHTMTTGLAGNAVDCKVEKPKEKEEVEDGQSEKIITGTASTISNPDNGSENVNQ